MSHVQPEQQITVYPPFTRYAGVDQGRLVILVAAVSAILLMLFLAVQRWRQRVRSATIFLVGYSTGLAANAIIEYRGLGHPPVWYVTVFLAVTDVAALIGCFVALQEVRKGTWDK